MSHSQEQVLRWAVENFGPVARNRDERAARLVEEALEVGQAEGLSSDVVERILRRVYERPAGELRQEIGGVAITLEALAENAGLSVVEEAEREWERVSGRSRDWWERKHQEKVNAGTADLSPCGGQDERP